MNEKQIQEYQIELLNAGYDPGRVRLAVEYMRRGHPLRARRILRKQICAANKSRGRGLCLASPEPGRRRCRFHRGMIPGTMTARGRENIRQAQYRRWAAWHAERGIMYQPPQTPPKTKRSNPAPDIWPRPKTKKST